MRLFSIQQSLLPDSGIMTRQPVYAQWRSTVSCVTVSNLLTPNSRHNYCRPKLAGEWHPGDKVRRNWTGDPRKERKQETERDGVRTRERAGFNWLGKHNICNIEKCFKLKTYKPTSGPQPLYMLGVTCTPVLRWDLLSLELNFENFFQVTRFQCFNMAMLIEMLNVWSFFNTAAYVWAREGDILKS